MNEIAIALNRLSREEMKLRLLGDILMDMEICRLEGWDIHEYVQEIRGILPKQVAEWKDAE